MGRQQKRPIRATYIIYQHAQAWVVVSDTLIYDCRTAYLLERLNGVSI